MAARRAPSQAPIVAARPGWVSVGDLGPLLRWLVLDAADCVLQPFYAMLDADKRLCWTDDLDRAASFATKQQAERFARDRALFDVRVVAGC